MPRDENNIGRSEYTPLKHVHYRELLTLHTKIVYHIGNKYDWVWGGYLYFDINAGDGGTESDPGSPRIFQSAITRPELNQDRPYPYKAIIIDEKKQNTEKVRDLFNGDPNVTIEHGDHNDIMPRYIDCCPVPHNPAKVYGLLFNDPNGMPSWELLRPFAAKYKKTDIVIYLSATAIKRVASVHRYPGLAEELGLIDKEYWIVRDIADGGCQQYTFAIGTNWDAFPDFAHLGFHNTNTPKGQDVLRQITLTKAEYAASQRKESGQLPLPFDTAPPYTTYDEYLCHPRYRSVRQMAIDRSGGTCERCTRNPVTEVHHLNYPKWGTFEENADNLQAICHDCHCKIHGKEN